MSYLPCSDFKWLSEDEINALDISSIKEDSDFGYILSADLIYPEAIHDLTNDFPLCPVKTHVEDTELSPYSQYAWKKIHNTQDKAGFSPKCAKVEKLLLTLHNKSAYIVHYRLLQLFLQLGMKLGSIQRVLQFRQRPYLKHYVDFNTERRKMAKTEFEKDFYKLLNNAVFGRFH